MSQLLCFNLDSRSWGRLTKGCEDQSDKTKKRNSSCLGETYEYKYTVNVTWEWFHCDKASPPVCIDKKLQCDMLPHPDCIYNKTGVMVAQDEENCLDEYKVKGLIKTSANFRCLSKFYYPEVNSTVANWTTTSMDDQVVIPNGTRVEIWATKCDRVSECSDEEDEKDCGFNPYDSMALGKSRKNEETYIYSL